MLLNVAELCRAAGGAEPVHLVTRETGRAVRGAIAAELSRMPAGEVLVLDFAGAGIVDFSCADECFAKLVTRLIAGEFGERYLVLTGLGDSQRENISVALERKRLPALQLSDGGGCEVLGTVTPHLRETLRVVLSERELSARALARLLGLELTTASTRLGSLHRQRLVRRREQPMGEGGREYLYEGVAGDRARGSGGGGRG